MGNNLRGGKLIKICEIFLIAHYRNLSLPL